MPAAWTPERFDIVDWSALVFEPSAHRFSDYATTVKAWLDAEPDEERKHTFHVLWVLLSLRFAWNPEDRMPLQPADVFHSVPRDALGALVSILDRVGSVELRARIADAAWLHGRACSPQIAAQCVRDYLALAERTYDPRKWVTSFSYLKRALDLAASLGRRNDLFRETSTTTLELLRSAGLQEPLYFSLRVIELLLEHRVGEPAELAVIATQIAADAEAIGDPIRPREYLERAAECWLRAKQTDKREATLRQVAAWLEKQAAVHRAAPDGAMHGAMLIEQAISVHRRAGGASADVERLKLELQGARAEAVAAMPRTDVGTFDITTLTEHARATVQGKPTWEALVALVTLSHPIALDRLRTRAGRSLTDAPLSALADFVRLSRSGQVIDRRPGSLDPGDDQATVGRMHEEVTTYHRFLVVGGIVPCLQQLQLEHGLTTPDFHYLACRSSFVPEGREPAFATGLTAGAQGDFFVAAHILVPQFEHAIRYQLNQLDVSTLTLPASGVQNEIDLNALLNVPKLRTLYDEATIFDWESLLTEKAGTNLRNELAHGLIEPGAREAECAYLWWTVLRCVVAPILSAARSAVLSGEDGQATSTDA